MSSRERVLAAINHQELDRVPIDLGGTRVTSIAVVAYARLLELVGIEGELPLDVLPAQRKPRSGVIYVL